MNMPKNRNQFTQTDWEESVRQRWLEDNSLVAVPLILWNRKINAELEKKQEQEDHKHQQLRQEQKLNSYQSLGERIGVIPKRSNETRKESTKSTTFKDNVIEDIYVRYSTSISLAEVIIEMLEPKINEEHTVFEKNRKNGDLSSEEIKSKLAHIVKRKQKLIKLQRTVNDTKNFMEGVITLVPELLSQKQMSGNKRYSSQLSQKTLQNYVQSIKEVSKKAVDGFSEQTLYNSLYAAVVLLKDIEEELLRWMDQEEQKTGKIFVEEVCKKRAEKMSKTLQKKYKECLDTELSLSKHLTHLIHYARLFPQEAICSNQMTSRIKRTQEKMGHFFCKTSHDLSEHTRLTNEIHTIHNNCSKLFELVSSAVDESNVQSHNVCKRL